jgi:hypothetical protein
MIRLRVGVTTLFVVSAVVFGWSFWWFPAGANRTARPSARAAEHYSGITTQYSVLDRAPLRRDWPLLALEEVAIGVPAPVENVTPRVPNLVHVMARHANGRVFYDYTRHNLRTNAGVNWQYSQMAGSPAAVCTYIALTNTAITAAATDTSLSGEITSNGLARTSGTTTHTANATSYTVSNTFTATATQAAQAAGLLNASTAGTMCFENTFTQVSLNANDTLTVTWTINF